MENISGNGPTKRTSNEYGDAAQEVAQATRHTGEVLKDEVKNLYTVAGKVGKQVLKDAQHVGEEAVSKFCDSSKETVDKVQASAKERPMQSIVAAAGVGLVLGYIFARRA